MSYVDLKHLLSDLALEAVRNPARAAWVRALAAYAAGATAQEPAVPLGQSRELAHLIAAGLLERRNDRVVCRDAFVPYLPYLQRQTARLVTAVESLRSSTPPVDVPTDLILGAALFNAGLYFEAHELLELTWRTTDGPERDFYHGIIQAAAAFYHFEKDNLHGARTLLAKSIRRLGPYPSPYLGMRLTGLRSALAKWQDYLSTTGGPDARRPRKPTLRFAG